MTKKSAAHSVPSGICAAACIYAMEHHIERLKDDHLHAQILADAIRDIPGLKLVPEVVETNLVWFEVDGKRFQSPLAVTSKLREQGILMSALGETTVRACTHLDVTHDDCIRAAAAIRTLQ